MSYFKKSTKLGKVVHHFSHEVDIGHEDSGVALFEKVVDAKKTLFEGVSFCLAHDIGELSHSFGGLCFVSSSLEIVDEKLQGRFLQDDREVRSLRLS